MPKGIPQKGFRQYKSGAIAFIGASKPRNVEELVREAEGGKRVNGKPSESVNRYLENKKNTGPAKLKALMGGTALSANARAAQAPAEQVKKIVVNDNPVVVSKTEEAPAKRRGRPFGSRNRPKDTAEETPAKDETDEEIEARISERFEIMEDMAEGCISGETGAMILAGPPGVGKSFTVMKVLKEWDPDGVNHIIIKGYVKATGLIRMLYKYRNRGQVVVFDDADEIFKDEKSLNILKAVCDTLDVRTVSTLSEYVMVDDDTAQVIPKTFDFEGTVIFITNKDFDKMIASNNSLAPHMGALVSRAHYIDCGLKDTRDYFVRVRQVVGTGGLLSDLTDDQKNAVLAFMSENRDNLREVSLRMAVKLAGLVKSHGDRWERVARITCFGRKA